MDSEPEFRATPAQIARITRTALTALAETHVIVPKEELANLLNEHSNEMIAEMWAMVLKSYQTSSDQTAAILSPERQKGVELGGKMLKRMHEVFTETFTDTFDANHLENSEK